MKAFNHKIIDSISKINRPDWDSTFGQMLQGYDFYRAVEESNLEGFSFYYILIYEGEKLLLIAPVFVSDFNLDIAVSGIAHKLIQGARKAIPRLLILKTLFCGSPISENGALGISKEAQEKDTLLFELIRIMNGFCRGKNIPLIIFKDFLKDQVTSLGQIKTTGFFLAESFPTVVTDLPFNSLDDYIASLSHNTRKNIRRKLKKADSSGAITVKTTNNIEDIIEEAYSLYLNTYNAGSVRFERLTKQFFINAGRFVPQTRFFLYYADDKLAAFNLCFTYKDTMIDEFIGFDYAAAYKYNLYYFSWCYNIEWCLKNSIKHYQTGQTDYHPKLKLGGRLIPLYVLIKHNNGVLNFCLRILAKLLTPTNLDANIKNMTKDA